MRSNGRGGQKLIRKADFSSKQGMINNYYPNLLQVQRGDIQYNSSAERTKQDN